MMVRGHGRLLPFVLLCAVFLAAGASVDRQPMSLADCMAYALGHNPQLAAAAARVQSKKAGVNLARATARPVAHLTASGRLQGPLQEIHIPISGHEQTIQISRAQQLSVGVGVVWPLWTGGRTQAALGAARAEVGAAEADLQQATEQLLYEVAVAYFRVLSAQAAKRAAEADLRQAQEKLRAAAAAHDAGAVTAADLAAAAAAERTARQVLVEAVNAVADAKQTLNRLLGRPLDERVELVDAPITLEYRYKPAEATAVALATRPELLALAHRQDAAKAAIAAARAQRNPTISLAGQAARQTATEVMPGHSQSISLEFSWPLVHSTAQAQEQRAAAAAEELKQTKQQLEAVISLQVAQAQRQLADADERLAAAQEAFSAAQSAAREANASYKAGAITRQRLVAAESALEKARARLSQTRDQVCIAHISYARSLGLMRALFVTPPEEGSQ